MTSNCPHLDWLIDTGQVLTTIDGKQVPLFEFRYQHDDAVLSAWARHLRNHYCLDDEIDYFRRGYNFSRAEYLNNIKFPDPTQPPGPGVRSGDFGELLIADYLEYRLDFWVPRTRYADKSIRNESTKGCDIIGFKFENPDTKSRNDTLAVFETKAQLASAPTVSRLQEAVIDSNKDQARKAESLNAIKQRLVYQGNRDGADKVERFQNIEDNPYNELYGAAAIFSTAFFNPQLTARFAVNDHHTAGNLYLLIIHGTDLMNLVTELYKRAADEA